MTSSVTQGDLVKSVTLNSIDSFHAQLPNFPSDKIRTCFKTNGVLIDDARFPSVRFTTAFHYGVGRYIYALSHALSPRNLSRPGIRNGSTEWRWSRKKHIREIEPKAPIVQAFPLWVHLARANWLQRPGVGGAVTRIAKLLSAINVEPVIILIATKPRAK